jgi:hypothetical protein
VPRSDGLEEDTVRHAYIRWHPDETVEFILDTVRFEECLRLRSCALCGTPLDYWIWFVEDEDRRDHRLPAMHEACAKQAVDVEPWAQAITLYMTRTRNYVVDVERDGKTVIRSAPSKETLVYQRPGFDPLPI